MKDPRDAPAVWRWAVWFAILAGLSQTFVLFFARLMVNRIVALDRAWMSMIGDAAVFIAATLVLQLAMGRLSVRRRAHVALAVFLFLLCLGPALLVSGLHRLSAIALCAGIGVQGARLLYGHLALFERAVSRTLWPLLGLGIFLGLVAGVSRDVAGGGPETSAAGRDIRRAPNVILVVLDTVRPQNLSLYGYGRQTSPRLDRFARTGVVFERAFSASPWTLPSHGALFTGQFPHALSADWLTPLDRTHPTLAEAFKRAGYQTAGFVGNLLYCTEETGLARGFELFKDYPLTPGTFVRSSWLLRPLVEIVRRSDDDARPLVDKRAADVNAEFEGWLQHRRTDRPFFVFLNYFDAHMPYRPPPPYDAAYGDGERQPDLLVRRTWSKTEIQRSMDAYDGEIRYVDDQLGLLLDSLTTRGLLENTLVVITSDHGEQFGEHGLFDHANSLYRQVLQVPLVLSFPGRLPPDRHIQHPVSLVNLPATVLELAGVGGEESHLPGRSLAEFWVDAQSESDSSAPLLAEVSKAINMPEWLPASKGAMQSVIVSGMHYIRHSDGREELYDFERDVAEVHDLSDRQDARAALEEARRALDLLHAGQDAGRPRVASIRP